LRGVAAAVYENVTMRLLLRYQGLRMARSPMRANASAAARGRPIWPKHANSRFVPEQRQLSCTASSFSFRDG